MFSFQTCWRRTVCQNRLRTASPQGIAALAAQGGVATLTEDRDATFSVKQFSSAEVEGRDPGRTILPIGEYRSALFFI